MRVVRVDKTLWVLLGAAVVSLIAGIVDNLAFGWIEGVSILLGVTVIIMLNAFSTHVQDSYFLTISDKINAVTCTVIRDGYEQEIPVQELVVGDLLKVKTGMTVPADGIFIQSFGLQIDESEIFGVEEFVRKTAYSKVMTEGNPFAFAGSKVEVGSGAMIVCAVGSNSTQRRTEILLESSHMTPLQQRLYSFSSLIGKWGILLSLLIFTVLVLHALIIPLAHTQSILIDLIAAVMLVVVAVPEGLLLAFKLSVTVAVEKMQKAGCLVRHLAVPEMMSAVSDVCTGKTGVFTVNKMVIKGLYLIGKEVKEMEVGEGEVRDLVANSCCLNSDSNLVYIPNKEDEEKGNKMECALLAMAKRWRVDYEALRRTCPLLMRVPFSPTTKWMGSACQVRTEVHIYIKGEPHTILSMCSRYLTSSGPQVLPQSHPFSDVIHSYTSAGLRVLAFAYKIGSFSPEELSSNGDPNLTLFTSEMIFLGFVTMEDPIRPSAKLAAAGILKSKLNLRLVTGDNLISSVNIGKELGILPENYQLGGDRLVMQGKELQKFAESVYGPDIMGNLDLIKGKNDGICEVLSQIRVLAAANPQQKHLFVHGLSKVMGRTVAVTVKDSSERALVKSSAVGMAIGHSSAQSVIESADLILSNDDFCSVAAAVKWGGNVISSLRKFLQFQLTVSIVVLVVCLLCAVVCGQIPIAPVHLLWINLITDVLAALAYAVDGQERDGGRCRAQGIVDVEVVRGVVGSAGYQVVVLMGVLGLGPWLFTIFPSWGEREWSLEGLVHFTLFLETLVFLQVFNLLYIRSTHGRMCSGLFQSRVFLGVVMFIVIVQVTVCGLGSEALHVNALTVGQHCVAVGLGAGGVVGKRLGDFVPARWLQWTDIDVSVSVIQPTSNSSQTPPPQFPLPLF